MNDPHVQALHYRMQVRENVRFDGAPALQHKTARFELSLHDGELTIIMVDHFVDRDAARETVEPFLREWSLHAALTSRRRAFSFEFLSADVVDRAPAPPPERGTVGFGMSIVGRATVSASGTVISNYAEYPAPPTSFNATPLVEALFQVYEAAVSEKRMAAAAGYFALTAVKTRVRDPSWPRESGLTRSKRVASALSVDAVVLNRLHELATEKGDISTARKVSDKAELDNPRPAHTAAELQWICEAIRVLALRLGQWEANAAGLPPLGMGDLPHV